MTNESWGQVREGLIKRVGKNNYVTWIEPLRLAGLRNGVARFEVPTTFFGDWVSRNFGDQIRLQLAQTGETVDRVEFAVGTSKAVAPDTKVPAVKAAPPSRSRQRRSRRPGARRRFSRCVV